MRFLVSEGFNAGRGCVCVASCCVEEVDVCSRYIAVLSVVSPASLVFFSFLVFLVFDLFSSLMVEGPG